MAKKRISDTPREDTILRAKAIYALHEKMGWSDSQLEKVFKKNRRYIIDLRNWWRENG